MVSDSQPYRCFEMKSRLFTQHGEIFFDGTIKILLLHYLENEQTYSNE